jgi:outer membrane lipoprotein SlyB
LKTRLISYGAILIGLSACGPTYSPDTYASNAVQQANKVEQGVIAGVRDVAVSASGAVGTVTGAAAGGIAGAQVGVGPTSAFASLGGALVGGIAGSTMEHATADTQAFEYIVRKGNGDLVSVTQKDKTPLVLGEHVLVIAGNQARVVTDYTVPPEVKPGKTPDPAKPAGPDAKPADAAQTDAKPGDAKPGDAKPADAKPADGKPADPLAAAVTTTAPATPASATPASATPTAAATTTPAVVTPAAVPATGQSGKSAAIVAPTLAASP